jgi:hypothetical protein
MIRRSQDITSGLEIVSELITCEVSYRDNKGITHAVEVTAESLYEAVRLARRALRCRRSITRAFTSR